MKKRLLSAILILSMVVSLCAGLAISASAAEIACYTLTPASGSNNSYAGNCDIAIDGITWNLTGNSTIQPWRIGGKFLDAVDREVYSKTAMSDTITKVELEVGTASGITVNSLTLTVASDADFTNVISTVSAPFIAESTITFLHPSADAAWTNAYYKFTFNVTVSVTSNKYVQFVGASFYHKEVDLNCTHDNATFTPATAATCTVGGNIAYYYCPDCQTYFTDNTYETDMTLAEVTTPAAGHTWGAWSVTAAATCTEDGEQTRTCSACQAIDTETIAATGHNYVNGVCSVCGAEEPAYLLTTSLKDGDEVIIYNASAGKAMSEDAIFTNYRAGVEVPVNDNKIVTDNSKIVWTVTASGSGFTFANDAGETLSATSYLSYASTDNIWTIDRATTAYNVYLVNNTAVTSDGAPRWVEWYAKYNEFSAFSYYEASYANFDMQLFVRNSCSHANTTLTDIAPTCTLQGVAGGVICEDCGAIVMTGTVIPATGHSFIDGYCSVCGAMDPCFVTGTCGSDLNWLLDLQSGELEITGTGEIPSWGSSSFAPWYTYRSSITSVSIDNGVTSIGNFAFYECKRLLSVTIPGSVTSIGWNGFTNCYALTDVYYYGSEAEWNTINIDWTNSCLTNAMIHYLAEGLKINTASLTLYEDIAVNFTASVPEGLTDPYMVVELDGQSYTMQASREDAQGRLVFEFMNLTPDRMGDNIKSTLYAITADGKLVHYCKPTYSVRQYCMNVMAAYPEDAELQTLLADMLVYGAATQRFTGHNADSLVTAGLDLAAASAFTNLTDTDLSMTDSTDANIQWTGAGLECGSRMSMYFTLTTTVGDATSVSVTINGRTTEYEYADIVTDDPTVCRVVFRGISASEYGDIVTAVLKSNGTPVQTLTYSVNSYIYAKQDDNTVENLSQLVQAIYNYGASAKSYLN